MCLKFCKLQNIYPKTHIIVRSLVLLFFTQCWLIRHFSWYFFYFANFLEHLVLFAHFYFFYRKKILVLHLVQLKNMLKPSYHAFIRKFVNFNIIHLYQGWGGGSNFHPPPSNVFYKNPKVLILTIFCWHFRHWLAELWICNYTILDFTFETLLESLVLMCFNYVLTIICINRVKTCIFKI